MPDGTQMQRILAELEALRSRVDEQQRALERLRAGRPPTERPAALPAALDAAAIHRASRRGVLTGAAGALAAFGLGAAAGEARPARADQLAAAIFFVPPTRVVDTRRTGDGAVTTGYDGATGNPITPGPVTVNTTRRFLINGKTFPQGNATLTVPPDISGIFCNVTVVGSPGQGYVTVFPGNITDANRPLASTLNPVTSPAYNFATVSVAPSGSPPGYGTIAVFSTLSLDVVIDLYGYFF